MKRKIRFVSCVLDALSTIPSLVQKASLNYHSHWLFAFWWEEEKAGIPNPLVCSFTQNVCTIRVWGQHKVGVDQNWKFTLWFVSYTCWKSQHLHSVQETRIIPTQRYCDKINPFFLSLIWKIQSLQIAFLCITKRVLYIAEQKGMKLELLKQKKRIFNSNSFSVYRDLSSSARCWHSTLQQISFLFQFKLILAPQHLAHWPWEGKCGNGGHFSRDLSLATSEEELKGYETGPVWPMRCKCQFSTP